MVKNLVLLVVLALLAVNTVSALKCYQCNKDDCDVKDENLKVCKEETISTPSTTESSSIASSPIDSSSTASSPIDSSSTASSPIDSSSTASSSTASSSTASSSTASSSTASSSSTNPTNPNPAVKFYNKFNRKEEQEDDGFKCLKYEKDDKTIRGCTKIACSSLDFDTCTVCSDEACNFGTNIQSWAFSTMILVAIVKYLL